MDADGDRRSGMEAVMAEQEPGLCSIAPQALRQAEGLRVGQHGNGISHSPGDMHVKSREARRHGVVVV